MSQNFVMDQSSQTAASAPAGTAQQQQYPAAALVRLITKQEHNCFNVMILTKDVSVLSTVRNRVMLNLCALHTVDYRTGPFGGFSNHFNRNLSTTCQN